MSLRTPSPARRRVEALAVALGRSAHSADLVFPASYARRVAARATESGSEIGLARLGRQW